MPMITFKCDVCGLSKDCLVKPKDLKNLKDSEKCPGQNCSGLLKRQMGTPKSTSKIIIDDGQAKAIEVMPDIQELMDNQADAGPNRGFGQT